jgi:hypothetical protein
MVRLTRFTNVLQLVFVIFSATCSAQEFSQNNETLHKSNEDVLVFAGRCFNDEEYRLRFYLKLDQTQSMPYYDYMGPAGIGTVQVETEPKVMVARVCLKLAEIINRDYLNP